MSYNLTDRQKTLLRWMVEHVRAGKLEEEFVVTETFNGWEIVGYDNVNDIPPGITENTLRALYQNALLLIEETAPRTYHCALLGWGYDAVDSNFIEG